jgi:hypothetical protein
VNNRLSSLSVKMRIITLSQILKKKNLCPKSLSLSHKKNLKMTMKSKTTTKKMKRKRMKKRRKKNQSLTVFTDYHLRDSASTLIYFMISLRYLKRLKAWLKSARLEFH